MAEFYEVLKRTVGALEGNTGDARRAVYERARKALIAQLEGFSPPLTPSEITSQRLSLEEAIRKVEGEAARAALGLGRPVTPRPAPSDRPPVQPTQPSATPYGGGAATGQPSNGQPANGQPATGLPAQGAASTLRDAPASQSAATANAPVSRPLSPPAQSTSPSTGSPINLASGRASTDAPGPKGPPFRATEVERAPKLPPAAGAEAPIDPPLDDSEPAAASNRDGGEFRSPLEAGGFEAFPQDFKNSRLPLIAGGLAAMLIVVGLAAVIYSQRDLFSDETASAPQQAAEKPAPVEKAEPVQKKPSRVESPVQGKSSERLPQSGGAVRTVPTQRVTAPSGAENGALNTSDSGSGDTTIVPAVRDSRSAGSGADAGPKPDSGEAGTTGTEVARVETQAPPASQTAGSGAVAQTAILYEEGSAGAGAAAGEKANGQVVWKKDKNGAVSIVTADISIPDKASSVKITIKPNTEDGFPASHLVEMQFFGPLGSAIRTVPGLIMKSTEQAQGDALVGAAIKVTDGLFWIALSAEDKDLARNRSLLESRGWIDIPLLYASGKRAILTIEKGVPGEQVVNQAFGEWAGN